MRRVVPDWAWRAHAYVKTMRCVGVRALVLYAIHRARIAFGWYESASSSPRLDRLHGGSLGAAGTIFACPKDWHSQLDARVRDQWVRDADRILVGELRYFHFQWRKFGGWRVHPLSGIELPLHHWSRTKLGQGGDVKWIWEPSRFEWVVPLGMAWLITGNERYVSRFGAMFESWLRDNPPELGPNWACGQECAIRLLSLCWAVAAFEKSEEFCRQWRDQVLALMALLASRIRKTLVYALAQNNNHALAELAALYVASVCLPQHSRAADWRRISEKRFLAVLRGLFSDNGYYLHHSFYYARSALRSAQVYALAASSLGRKLDSSLCDILLSAAEFLARVMDPATGRVPNFGGNDGSNVLALSTAEYGDFRPLLADMRATLGGALTDCSADESRSSACWWRIRDSQISSLCRPAAAGPQRDYYVFGGTYGKVMARCGKFLMRPAHADLLHVDIWIGGRNVARDAGSFQYVDSQHWGEYLESTRAHNAIVVNGLDQMPRLGRFMWGDWARSRILVEGEQIARGPVWSAEHYGYRRLGVTVRRSIYTDAAHGWVIVDDILACSTAVLRSVELYWHLDPSIGWDPVSSGGFAERGSGIRVHIVGPNGCSTEALDGASFLPSNGESAHYGQMESQFVVKLLCHVKESVRIVTCFGAADPSVTDSTVTWADIVVSRTPGGGN